ncbi:hypothetical protein F0562_013515 [Nyssa sinensis]|uniref:BRCT domain-containing protein n=1 Tax=Nyssa sinensis TaxID=561372 RepID=A0A5J4ZMT5_9ASTE|nr:hypothetical protein F0562_013515 [Nyssa sinensis]
MAVKDQQNISTGKDVNLSSKDEGRYNSCHLFLSGEDNSPVSFAPPSRNVVHFHLHLSLDCNSQNMPSPLVDTSQTERFESNDVLSMQQTETSAGQEKDDQCNMDHYAGLVNLPPLTPQKKTFEYSVPQSLANNKDSEIKHGENVRHLKVADANDAVELSIAASEALVIHELVKSGSSTNFLPAAAVLEVALRVKQARLKDLEEIFHYPTEEISEIDFLSDLDESTMADAFEDVGLSVNGPNDLHACDSFISQVKDTLTSENHDGCDKKNKNEGHGTPEVGYDDIYTKQRLRDELDIDIQVRKELQLEFFDGDGEKKLTDDLALGLNASNEACKNDPMIQWSSWAHSDISATTERDSFAMGDMTSFQPQANGNSSLPAGCSENAEKDDKLRNVVPDRFQSRWLGGWTWKKDANASAPMEHNNAKSIPEFFVDETSYLSESADIVPDENSFVQKHDKGSNMASQSSIPFEGLCDRANEGILLSQDVVRSSSLSMVDPLCSVVPCSISSENICSTLAQTPNEKVDSGKCFSPALERVTENLQRTSSLNVEYAHVEGEAVPVTDGGGSRATVVRQLASLKTYSMLLPSCDAFLERESIYFHRSFPLECNSGLLPSEQNMGCEKVSTGLPIMSTFKCATSRGIEEYHKISVMQNPVTDIINQKRNYEETANHGAELQVQMQKERSSPLILNRGMSHCFQASKHFVQDFNGEENPEWTAVPEKNIVLPKSKNLQNAQFKCKIPHDIEVPAKKRVRFSEANIKLPQKKDLQKHKFTYRNRSTTRAGRRLKQSNPNSDSGAQEVKRRQTNCPNKDGNRLIFQDTEFLLTGFSSQMETEIEGLIRKHGGIVLSDIPSPKSRGTRSSRFNHQQLPVVLCLKKLQTTKFLYGCAVNACLLKVNWLTDSVAAGSLLPLTNYVILSNHVGGRCTRIGKHPCCNNHNYIFDGLGIMLHGKHSFCTKLAKVVKHGGGQVFRTLQWLVKNLDAEKISIGAIVAEDESRASRHLKHCASEQKIPMMPASWIINSLHGGRLLPLKENKQSRSFPLIKVPVSVEFSEEI